MSFVQTQKAFTFSTMQLAWQMYASNPTNRTVPNCAINGWLMAVRLIEGTGLVQPSLPEPEASPRQAELRARRLSSAELAVLATNHLGQVRFMSLQILERNGDAKAVELTLPLLRDTNSVIRSRVFTVIRNISGQDISENDPDKWDQWWLASKATFKPRH